MIRMQHNLLNSLQSLKLSYIRRKNWRSWRSTRRIRLRWQHTCAASVAISDSLNQKELLLCNLNLVMGFMEKAV